MAARSAENHLMKDATEWTPADVREFILTALPGHHCVDFFRYTSGYVLCSLTKDDLRRQARDEEIANIIWTELAVHRKPPGELPAQSARGVSQQSRELPSGGAPGVIVYVRMRGGAAAAELEVALDGPITDLKAQIAEIEGVPPDNQRLIYNGMNLQDSSCLSAYGVRHGSTILLVPHLREHGKHRPVNKADSAARGILMVPGSKAWIPQHTARPYLPVLSSDVSRKFPVGLEFDTPEALEAFMTAAREEPPVLEIPASRPGKLPTEAHVRLDPDTEGVTLDMPADALAANMQYEAFAHFGGRGGGGKVHVITGAALF